MCFLCCFFVCLCFVLFCFLFVCCCSFGGWGLDWVFLFLGFLDGLVGVLLGFVLGGCYVLFNKTFNFIFLIWIYKCNRYGCRLPKWLATNQFVPDIKYIVTDLCRAPISRFVWVHKHAHVHYTAFCMSVLSLYIIFGKLVPQDSSSCLPSLEVMFICYNLLRSYSCQVSFSNTVNWC